MRLSHLSKIGFAVFFFSVLFGWVEQNLHAQPQMLFPFKGYLEQNGDLVNVPTRMLFYITNQEAFMPENEADLEDEAVLWRSAPRQVQVFEGHFDVALGDITSEDPALNIADFTSAGILYVGVMIDQEGQLIPLQGKQQLLSAPFSLVSLEARHAQNADFATDAGTAQNAISADDFEVRGQLHVRTHTIIEGDRFVDHDGDPNPVQETGSLVIRNGNQQRFLILDDNELSASGGPLHLQWMPNQDVILGNSSRPGDVKIHGAVKFQTPGGSTVGTLERFHTTTPVQSASYTQSQVGIDTPLGYRDRFGVANDGIINNEGGYRIIKYPRLGEVDDRDPRKAMIDSEFHGPKPLIPEEKGFCFLTEVFFRDLDHGWAGAGCRVYVQNGTWYVHAYIEGRNHAIQTSACKAQCIQFRD